MTSKAELKLTDTPSLRVFLEAFGALCASVKAHNVGLGHLSYRHLHAHYKSQRPELLWKAMKEIGRRLKTPRAILKSAYDVVARWAVLEEASDMQEVLRPLQGDVSTGSVGRKFYAVMQASWQRARLLPSDQEAAEIQNLCLALNYGGIVASALSHNVYVYKRPFWDEGKEALAPTSDIGRIPEDDLALIVPYLRAVIEEDFEIAAAFPDRIERALAPVRDKYQKFLDSLEGNVYPDYETKKRLVSMLQGVAHRLNAAFLCPHCSQPARLKCSMSGNSRTGVFSFAHSKSTHGATASVPKLTLTWKDAVPPEPAESAENVADA